MTEVLPELGLPENLQEEVKSISRLPSEADDVCIAMLPMSRPLIL